MTDDAPLPVSSGIAEDQLLGELRGRRRSPDSWPYSLSKGSASHPVKLISDSAARGSPETRLCLDSPWIGAGEPRLVTRRWKQRLGGQTWQ